MNKRQKLDSKKKYYVYGLYDPAKKLPFYISKGSGRRKDQHFKKSAKGNNPYKECKIAKIKQEERDPYSAIISEGLTEAEAYDEEYILISFLDVQANCRLTNLCYNWGEGFKSGENHPMRKNGHTEEAKQKISESTSGKNYPMYGKSHTEESIKKMSESSTGRTMSKETREKMGKSRRGKSGPNTKLTKEKAAEIKWLLQQTSMPQKEIGNEYGVVRTTISAINTEKNWDYVEPKEVSR